MDTPDPSALNCDSCGCTLCHPAPGTQDTPLSPCPCARDFCIDAQSTEDEGEGEAGADGSPPFL